MSDFPTQFRGEVITPDSPDYDTARASLGAAAAPVGIVLPESPADVALVVRYAASRGILPAVRSGGHSGHNFVSSSPTLLIDLSRLVDIEVLENDLVRLGPGSQWGTVAQTLGEHWLAVTSGDTSSVGVGGLILGGGVGWLVRLVGLTIDTLVEAEVVTAAGELVTASEQQNPDLFWALRGGGGNFGVVTSYTVRARRLPGVVGATIAIDPAYTSSAMKTWRDVMREAPDELSATFLGLPAFGPEAPASVQIVACWAGDDLDAATAALDPLVSMPGVTAHTIAPATYASLLNEAPVPPVPLTIVDNASFTPNLTDELIDAVTSLWADLGLAVFSARSLGGAFSRVPSDATAVAYRESEALLFSAVMLPADADQTQQQRIIDRWNELPGPRVGTFSTFISRTGPKVLAEIYPPVTLDRLRSVKAVWDPTNLFRLNQNVAPE
jgi:FAD/FMN-containing dehydrogenase